MRALLLTIGLITAAPLVAAHPVAAGADAARPGDHPALAARRVISHQGYDYTANFYPHPAWMYLSAQAPHPMSDHPAVLVFRRAEEERRAAAASAPRVLAER